ncbi:MAG: tRNA (guanosine(37)-N1)-methyltransferase TrmD [Candidatus Shikimatogenerans sp. JK-2022]|nr:tRNA (guanosine(37)-N1)-methyltransferase TrmD [Candidatus Shikimatogenerans bostrichidophilus]
MQIDIITLYSNFWLNLKYPIIYKSIKKKKIKIKIYNLKKYFKKIDDYQYGGGFGMILKIEPFYKLINFLKKKNKYEHIIFLTPDAPLYKNKYAKKLASKKKILFISGYYKGIDQRIRDLFITKEFSIGKFILSCGDLAILIIIDSIIRFIPGVLGNIKSTYTDTYNNKYYYEYPLYTRPYNFKNILVPKILLSGNHKKILNWRKKKILKKKGTK